MTDTVATVAGKDAEDRVAVASNWRLVWWRFRRHHLAMASAGLLIFLYLIVLVPDFFSTQDPERTDARQAFIPVQMVHLFDDGSLAPWVPAIVGKRNPTTLRMEWTTDPQKKVLADFVAVHRHAQPDDACHAALAHHGIVQHDGLRAAPTLLVLDEWREGETRLGGVGPAHQRVECPVESLRRHGGQEAEPTQVYAQNRRLGTVERPGPAQQGAVAAQSDEAVELGCAVERRGRGLGPERPDLLLGVQRDAEPRCDLREMREDALEIAVARVADDPDVHEWVRDSSAASARTRAAIPEPVSPTSASCCARGACS